MCPGDAERTRMERVLRRTMQDQISDMGLTTIFTKSDFGNRDRPPCHAMIHAIVLPTCPSDPCCSLLVSMLAFRIQMNRRQSCK
jgi:hypothetical protein